MRLCRHLECARPDICHNDRYATSGIRVCSKPDLAKRTTGVKAFVRSLLARHARHHERRRRQLRDGWAVKWH